MFLWWRGVSERWMPSRQTWDAHAANQKTPCPGPGAEEVGKNSQPAIHSTGHEAKTNNITLYMRG